MTVKHAWHETPEIKCFDLRPVAPSSLPHWEPGAHIDVHLPDATVRQYSLWNGPFDKSGFLVGVKLEPESRGGSIAMHQLEEGSEITVGLPRNNFPLKRGRGRSLLLAGGIGITPLLSMARSLERDHRPYHLHHFVRSIENAPFRALFSEDPSQRTQHVGLIPPALNNVLMSLLSGASRDDQVYVCGPAPFIDLARSTALACGIPKESIFVEHFGATKPASSTEHNFEVVLLRSRLTICVRADQTIIEAMADAGVDILTSCEQGVCGTCVTTVLEGVPDHRDQYLNTKERAEGKLITPCVSRCEGTRIVLDL